MHQALHLVMLSVIVFNPSGCVRRSEKRKQSSEDVWSELQQRLRPTPGSWLKSSLPSEDACIDSADVRANTIIRTNASRAAGAVFVDFSDVRSSHECVAKCCSVSSCNLAIVDSKSDPAKCFLFDCKHPTVCEFTSFDGYSSISLPRGSARSSSSSSSSSHVRRVNIPSPRGPPPTTTTSPSTTTTASMRIATLAGTQETDLDSWRLLLADDESRPTKEQSNRATTVSPGMLEDVIKMLQLSRTASKAETVNPVTEVVFTTVAPTTPTLPTTTTTLGPCQSAYEVHCANMDGCVALNDVCDGFAQCADASDENSDVCQAVRGRPDYLDGSKSGRGGNGAGQEASESGRGGNSAGPEASGSQSGKSVDEKTSGNIAKGVQSTVKKGGNLDVFPTPVSYRLAAGKMSSQGPTSAFLAASSSSSSSSSRSRKPTSSKTNPRLMGDKNEMTRQLDAMTTTTTARTTTTMQTMPGRPLQTRPAAARDANGFTRNSSPSPLRPESLSEDNEEDDDNDRSGDERKQKSSAPSVDFHRSHLTNSSYVKPTTTTKTLITTSPTTKTISQHGFEDPLTTESVWERARVGRDFVRRNASVALGCGLVLFTAFVVFASVKLKTFWLPSLRARGRRGNLQNREADYLINGMYL